MINKKTMPYRKQTLQTNNKEKEIIPHSFPYSAPSSLLPVPVTINRKYGWVKKERKLQHRIFAVSKTQTAITKVDLRPFCPPVYDQGQLGSCHTAQTEVLTENGWCLFSDLSGDERLATVNPETSELIYEMPTRLIAFDYEGDLIIGNDKKSLDFAVTLDHKMLVRKWNESKRTLNDNYEFVMAKELGWKTGLMVDIDWKGENSSNEYILSDNRSILMKDWLRFLGLFYSKGNLNDKIEFQIKDKIFVRDLLNQLNLVYLYKDGTYLIDDPVIYKELKTDGIPTLLFKQTAQNIKEFLSGFFLDPNIILDRWVDDIQRLLFLAGETSYIEDGRFYRTKKHSINRKHDITRTPYKGKVYCAEVPTYHTLITRHNRRILISGNCTANAIAGAYEFDEIKQKSQTDFRPSRLFIYYGERAKEGTINQDAGADISDGVNFINTVGVCPETVPENNTSGITKDVCWEYDISKFAVKPPDQCFTFASNHKTLNAYPVQQNLEQLKQALIDGYPFTLGIIVYPSFESAEVARTGMVPMPSLWERCKPLGGHALLCCGFDDNMMIHGEKGGFLIRNSWGPSFGLGGYCYMPYKYILDPNLSSDFWTITKVIDTY